MNWKKMVFTLIPFAWTIGCLPFVNHVHPMIFGIPFLAFWLSFGVIVAFVCIMTLYKMDEKKQDSEHEYP